MGLMEDVARSNRGMHDEDGLSTEDKILLAKQELQELRNPKAFDIGDGVNAVVGAISFGALSSFGVDALNKIDGVNFGTKEKLIVASGAAFLGAVSMYLEGQKEQERYADARVVDASMELNGFQNDLILSNQQQIIEGLPKTSLKTDSIVLDKENKREAGQNVYINL